MNENFYKLFEDQFRGSRYLILTRLEQYLPFVEPFKSLNEKPRAVDLGCGRGEWLEFLIKNEFDAEGYDIDDAMLDDCKRMNLPANKNNIFDILKNLPENSFSIVSAFHVVEHISFDEIHVLVKEAYRVLKPGGLLILETPNSENIVIGTNYFYADPSHIRPIQKDLLKFMTQYHGFYRSLVLRLQEDKKLDLNNIQLINVLTSVSPDYAVIAQKNAEQKILSDFDELFNKEYGLSLMTIASNYDQRIRNKEHMVREQNDFLMNPSKNIEEILSTVLLLKNDLTNQILEQKSKTQDALRLLEEKSLHLDTLLQEQEKKAQDALRLLEEKSLYLDTLLQEQEKKAQDALRLLEEKSLYLDTLLQEQEKKAQDALRLLEERLQESYMLQNTLKNIYNSKSWEITKPLRELNMFKNKFIEIFFYLFIKNQQIKNYAIRLEKKLPESLRIKIKSFYYKNIKRKNVIQDISKTPDILTPSEKEVYQKLLHYINVEKWD